MKIILLLILLLIVVFVYFYFINKSTTTTIAEPSVTMQSIQKEIIQQQQEMIQQQLQQEMIQEMIQQRQQEMIQQEMIQPQQEMIFSTTPPTISFLTKDDKERVVIIKINNNESKIDLKIDTEFLGQIFDDLINLIKRLIKKLMNESNQNLNITEINDLLPQFIAESSENILKLITMVVFSNNPDSNDVDNIKTKLLSLLQNNLITDHLLKNNNMKSSIENLQDSTKILNNEIKNSRNNNLASDVRADLPEILSKIIYDMSKNIINNIILFDKDGNMINTDNISKIKYEFKNILNKYLPYKQIYFETSNNGSDNLPSLTLKLDQLNQEEKVEPIDINPHEMTFLNYLNTNSELMNVYQEINNSNINSNNTVNRTINNAVYQPQSTNMLSSQMEMNIPQSTNILNSQMEMNIPRSSNMLNSQMEMNIPRTTNMLNSQMEMNIPRTTNMLNSQIDNRTMKSAVYRPQSTNMLNSQIETNRTMNSTKNIPQSTNMVNSQINRTVNSAMNCAINMQKSNNMLNSQMDNRTMNMPQPTNMLNSQMEMNRTVNNAMNMPQPTNMLNSQMEMNRTVNNAMNMPQQTNMLNSQMEMNRTINNAMNTPQPTNMLNSQMEMNRTVNNAMNMLQPTNMLNSQMEMLSGIVKMPVSREMPLGINKTGVSMEMPYAPINNLNSIQTSQNMSLKNKAVNKSTTLQQNILRSNDFNMQGMKNICNNKKNL